MNLQRSTVLTILPFILLVLISLPFRFYNSSYPLLDAFNFRQTQTATIALNFYKNGINFLQTELDIFGIGKERFLTLEFPLYEAIVAMVNTLFFYNDIWGRIISILSGYVGAWYLYKIAFLFLKERKIAFFASFFFLFTPLSMFYQRTVMIDPFVIAILLSGFYYATKWVRENQSRNYILGIFLLTIGFIHKGLYGPFWLLPIIVLFVKNRHRTCTLRKFLFLLIIPIGILFLWQHHVNSINVLAGHGYFTTDSSSHREWNFGTIAERFDIGAWKYRLWQMLEGIFLKPGFPLFIFGLYFLRRYKYSTMFLFWVLSGCINFVVLFHIQMQNYYQLILVPVFSIPMAVGTVRILNWGISTFIRPKKQMTAFILFSVGFCSFFALKSWVNILPSYSVDWNWHSRLLSIADNTKPFEYGIFISAGYDWNSVYTYIPKRKMLLVSVENVTFESLSQWRTQGYSFIVLHSPDMYESYLKNMNKEYRLNFLTNLPEVMRNQEFSIYRL